MISKTGLLVLLLAYIKLTQSNVQRERDPATSLDETEIVVPDNDKHNSHADGDDHKCFYHSQITDGVCSCGSVKESNNEIDYVDTDDLEDLEDFEDLEGDYDNDYEGDGKIEDYEPGSNENYYKDITNIHMLEESTAHAANEGANTNTTEIKDQKDECTGRAAVTGRCLIKRKITVAFSHMLKSKSLKDFTKGLAPQDIDFDKLDLDKLRDRIVNSKDSAEAGKQLADMIGSLATFPSKTKKKGVTRNIKTQEVCERINPFKKYLG